MKLILSLLVSLTLMLLLYGAGGAKPDSVHLPLPVGETNGSLKKIGLRESLNAPAAVFLRTNYSSCGVILRLDPAHEFPDGTSEAVLFRTHGGGSRWMKREWLKNFWISRKD